MRKVCEWFESNSMQPFEFQQQAWQAHLNGQSGLIHAPTGIGKTYAAWFGPMIEWMADKKWDHQSRKVEYPPKRDQAPHLRVLWITPLRALSNDIQDAHFRSIRDLKVPWTVECRTGDTSSTVRKRQKERLPTALITTPESLSLLLSYPGAEDQFRHLYSVVVDEWHELLGSKRGVMVELALARLRSWNQNLRTWGLSATLNNIDESMRVLLGLDNTSGVIIRGSLPKVIKIESIIPSRIDTFPWAGHLGLKLLPQVLEKIESASSTLIFTNTRSQTEIWFQEILNARPDWEPVIALHHGSLDRIERDTVEKKLRQGKLRCVVCTSSLDLGVDFTPVDCVIQIGSPKGIARLMQRAGRSGHQPGSKSRVVCVPTNAMELIEIAAVRRSVEDRIIESRYPVAQPLDVLAQHMVTVALGNGFRADELFEEVRQVHAYRHLSRREFDWVLNFASTGGPSLGAYPEYAKIAPNNGQYVVSKQKIAHRHRMNIGTITADASILVKFTNGRRLGAVEERFAAKLKPGDCFAFAGRLLEHIRIRDMTLWVRKCRKRKGSIPQWMGGRMPLSTQLAEAVKERLDEARRNIHDSPELKAVRPLLEIQSRRSLIPRKNELLIENLKSREGNHLFLFTFAGHLVNEGLGALFSYRLSKTTPMSFSIATNDYGLELLSDRKIPSTSFENGRIFTTDDLFEDILESINVSEMAQRRFRGIARVAGLVFQGYPGRQKSWGQVQASSSLLFKVFRRYDPGNLLVEQSTREVLERQLEYKRLSICLNRLQSARLQLIDISQPTPLSFPIMVNRLRTRISSEKLADRVRRMQLKMVRSTK